MDAKSLQIVLTVLIGAVIAVAIADVAIAVRQRNSRPRPRTVGVVLVALGFLLFASIAWVSMSPQPGWEASNPKDEGFGWFLFLPAALLGSITLLATLRPRHAGTLLLGIAAGAVVVLFGAYLAGRLLGQTPGEGSEMALAVILCFFCVPAVGTGLILIDEDRRRSGPVPAP